MIGSLAASTSNNGDPVKFLMSERQYWTRAWTFQETALAKQGLIFRGRDILALDGVRTLVTLLARHVAGLKLTNPTGVNH